MPTDLSERPRRARNRGQIKRNPRSPLWRLRVWQILLGVGAVAVVLRLYYLQVHKAPELVQRVQVQRQQHNMLMHRGAITDRRGLPLAIDTTRYDVYVHTDALKKTPDESAEILANIVKKPKEKILKLLTAGYTVVTLGRHLDRETVEELQHLNWAGVDIVPKAFRQYPEGKLAGHVLGYVDPDAKGQGGIEQGEQRMLTDTGAIPKPQLDGHGHTILMPSKQPSWDITPPLGRHVELTIDNYLQHMAEKELYAVCKHSQALRGTVLLTDPTNGEILAWANYPTFDPNRYNKYDYETMKNWAMVDVYQPGSTFKILTVASGLQSGAITPSWTYFDTGALTVGNRTVHNHDGGHGLLDLKKLFIHSSNVASAKIGLLMTPKQFWTMLSNFGLGKRTGIDLPGESAGLLTNYKYWKPIDQATTGFGQGAIAVTPLQLAAGVGAVANGGIWVQPHLIRRVYDPRTGVTEKWTEPVKRRVISQEISKLECGLLADNIYEGSQIAGQIPGYRVAGKTGTAQKVTASGRGYQAGATIASFIGFLPAKNPQILCLAVVDTPRTDGGWGNTVAGPIFNSVAMEAARYLNIPPDYVVSSDKGPLPPGQKRMAPVVAPSLKYAAELGNAAAADPDQTSASRTH